MATKPTINQVAQYGIEAVPGVAVPATRRPASSTLTIGPTGTSGKVRASGSRFSTAVYKTKVGSTGSIKGTPDYIEIMDQLALVFGAPTSSAVAGIELHDHDFTFGGAPATLTVEQGDTENASKAVHVFATDFSMEYGRNSETASVEIGLQGGLHTDGETLTPDEQITFFDAAVAPALHVDMFVDATPAAYGTTKVENLLRVKLNLPGLNAGNEFLDSAKPSIAEVVAQALDGANLEITVNADTEGRTWRSLFEGSGHRFVRLAITDPETGELIHFDAPVSAEDPGTREDDDAKYVAKYTLPLMKVGTEQLKARVRNTIAGEAPVAG